MSAARLGLSDDGEASSPALAFARHLVQIGRMPGGALERATSLALQSHEPLELVLTRLGLISERDLTEMLARFLDLPLSNPSEFPQTPMFDALLPADFLRARCLLPIRDGNESVTVAMANPLDDYAIEAVRFAIGKPVLRCAAYPADIESALDRLYGERQPAPRNEQISERPAAQAEDDIERVRDGASEAPVIRLVNLLISRAVEARASDIHIEPSPNELRVRYRIDGVLRCVDSPPVQLSSAILSRIKVMSKLNIAERRLPQDGRIATAVRGRDIDIRVAISPTMHGERATLRILDRTHLKLDFTSLGFDQAVSDPLRSILANPHGILLVSGPTGSGKTTTLYAALGELNDPGTNILTIEDPVEYQLAGISQVQVKPQIGLTFAHALRSFLRQDPDVMMVGEIRDLETAEIAVQAALTGHLILSTVHTNDAASTITRLLDMGVQDYLITSTLNGVVAQRLVRTLCPDCREPYQAMPELLRRFGMENVLANDVVLYRAMGCDACNGTGYRGRTALVEVLTMNDALRQAVLRNADAAELETLAAKAGMRNLRNHGFAKALAGWTSVEEVFRVAKAE